jgi:hypothetical protein
MTSRRTQDLIGCLSGLVVALPVVFSLFIGILVVVVQCVTWLKFGYWPGWTLQDGALRLLGRPIYSETGWIGLDRAIWWCINNLSLAELFIVILPTIWLVACWIFWRTVRSTAQPPSSQRP